MCKEYPETWDEAKKYMKRGWSLHTWHRSSPANIWIESPAGRSVHNFEWGDITVDWKELKLAWQGDDIWAPSLFSNKAHCYGPEEKVYILNQLSKTQQKTIIKRCKLEHKKRYS